MKPFLKETAQKIISNYETKIDKLCIILPNKRAKMFFNTYFAQISGQTAWAPYVITIDSFIKNFTKLNEPDSLTLIFELYEVFNETDPQDERNFDNFFHLGEIILRDFAEIDGWLVDVDLLFKNIKNSEEIESTFDWLTEEQKEILQKYWLSFSSENQSEQKKNFIKLWNLLPIVYKKYKERLVLKGIAYPAMGFRVLSENIDKELIDTQKYEKYIFAGFNALNRAEEKLFIHFKNSGKAEFFWDTDVYYQNDYKQEAGDFLRKNFRNIGITDYELPNNLKNPEYPKNIQTIGVPLEVGQAKILPQILESLQIEEYADDTAIILTNENMLFPVLYSLPENLSGINITMGYPFSQTSIFTLIKLYIDLHLNSQKLKKDTYNYKRVIAILRQADVWEKTKEVSQMLISDIENEQIFEVSPKRIMIYDNELLDNIFTPVSEKGDSNTFIENILNILYLLFDKTKDANGKPIPNISNEYIHKAYTTIKSFGETLRGKKELLSFRLTSNLLLQMLKNTQISFSGQAVQGLQLMGVLETRNLDFKNVIILGMNEGNFPSINAPASFISQSVRYVFGMPVIKYKDSMYAYLFYRLIQRAKNITIIYNSLVNTGNTGELSRFVQQLKLESELKITDRLLEQQLIPAKPEKIKIPKNEQIEQILDKYIEKNHSFFHKLTPSAINTYLSCSLQFYFRYIALLKPVDKIEEEISPASFGSILHNALENLYTDLIKEKNKKNIEKEDFKILKSRVNDYVERAFKKHYLKPEDKPFDFSGNHIIVLNVLQKYTQIVLDYDKEYSPFTISSLEDKSFSDTLKILVNDQEKFVGIKGIIDRVDEKDGIFRIIDYKTGTADKEFKDFSELFDRTKPKLKKNILQTFMYAMLFRRKNMSEALKTEPAIFDIRKMNSEYFSANLIWKYEHAKQHIVNYQIFEQLLPEFEQYLSEAVSEIFAPETCFEQTEDTEKCQWCEFGEICR